MISSPLPDRIRQSVSCGLTSSAWTGIWSLFFLLAMAAGCRTNPVAATYPTPVAAAQAAISETLGMPVSLRVQLLNEHDGWVFLSGLPLTAERERIDYTGTVYAREIAEGYFDDHFMALLRRSANTAEGWRLLELSIGATDAPFVDWFARYGLPASMAAPVFGQKKRLPEE